MPQVTILLYGPPRLQVESRPVELGRQKALALVAYLALARDPVSRDELASLFWPELNQERARAALRTTLPTLTTAVPFPWLAADRRLVQLQTHAVAIDVVQFRELVAEVRRHPHPLGVVCSACRDRLRAAEALYRGEFLQGFSLADSPDFETWQLAQREALRHEMIWTLRALTDAVAEPGDRADEEQVQYGRRWLELDPLNEGAHRWLMAHYAAIGQRSDALRQYAACVDLLQHELGVAPAPETVALYERIARHPDAVVRAGRPEQPRNAGYLPAEAGGFVGREAELDWLLTSLRDPECRLVTLTGPGGIGKTRLALRAATLLRSDFVDGACMAPLDDVRSVAEALRQIAAVIDAGRTSNEPPLAALQGLLARRQLLLLLDNLEHLPTLADELVGLLAAAPGLKILATSRERLALRAEHVLPISGLAVPPAETGSAEGFAAVQLFVQRARQVRPDFTLSPTATAPVVQICTLVEGMPLGIELATAWTRTLTPAAIAAEIARSPDFLHAAVRDLPERHRSLRNVFDHSWRLLPPIEQTGFRRLSVFRGGFSVAAAQAVAQITFTTLAALEDKSLIRHTPEQRYDFHPLLRQYAAERLSELTDEAAELEARHAEYIAGMLERIAPQLGNGELLSQLANDASNIQVAWFWAVDNGAINTVGRMVEGLAQFCELRSYRQEAEAALAYAETRLAAQLPVDPAGLRVLAHIQAWRGHFCQFLGRYDESAAALERSLTIVDALDDQMLRAFCLKAQGINANALGEHQRAIELHRESLHLYQHLGDQAGIGEVFNRMGGAAYDMGDLAEGRRCWEASLAAYTHLNDRCGMSRAFNNLGEVCRILGDYAESQRLSEASLKLSPALGPSWSISPLNNLAIIARLEGRFAEARRLHEQSLAACHRVGDVRGATNTTFFLGELELALDQPHAAEMYFTTSLERYRALRQRQGISACLIGLAEVAITQGAYHQAAELAREALGLAEASAAQITAGRALSSLGWALLLGGDPAAGAAALADAEAALLALGAHADAQTVAARRQLHA